MFFDDFSELALNKAPRMTQSVGDAFRAHRPSLSAATTPYGERERDFQLYRRGRYVEFNPVWDRGTHWPAVGRAHRIDPAVHAAAGGVVVPALCRARLARGRT